MNGDTRVDEFVSQLGINQGGVTYWPRTTFNGGDCLNFHNAKNPASLTG